MIKLTHSARLVAFAAAIALMPKTAATAQGNPAGEIRGRVVDYTSKAPITTATVEVNIVGAGAGAAPLVRASTTAGMTLVRNTS